MKGQTKKVVLGALVAGVMAVGANSATAGSGHKCMGGNACKGQTKCAGAHGSCAGGNSCKGKGWIYTKSKEECAKIKSNMGKKMKDMKGKAKNMMKKKGY